MSVVGLLKVVSFNGRSIRNKLVSIMTYLKEKHVDIAFVQETWIRKSDGHLLTQIREYGYDLILYRKVRRLDLGGGVAIIYKSRLKIRNIKKKSYPSFEHIECQLTTEKGPVNFVNIYRPEYSEKHRYTTNMFVKSFSDLLDSVASSNIPWFLVGDYNIHVELCNENLHGHTTSRETKIKDAKFFINTLNENNVVQLVNTETHKQHGTLDLLLTQVDKIQYVQSLSIGYKDEICESDHFPVIFYLELKPSLKDDMVVIKKRNFTHFDVNLFKDDFKKHLTPGKLEHLNVNACVEVYNSTLRLALDKQSPVISKTVRKRPNQKWFNSNLREMKRQKRAVEREWKKNPTSQLFDKLKDIKNQYKCACFNTRTTYISSTIDKFKRDKKKLHDMVKYATGMKKERILPAHTSKEDLANEMTQFYHTKVQNIRNEIQSINNNNVILQQNQCSSTFLEFELIDEAKLKIIMSNMKSKGHPHDPTPVWILKECFDELSSALLSIINKSMVQECVFPDQLKHAVVAPTIKDKDGDTEANNNYRPVSNLVFLSKLIEKCANTQIQEYLTEYSLYPKYQSAYRKHHSCETALLKVVNDIQLEISNKQMVALIALDLSSAFDTIDHKHLIRKLKQDFGISGNVLKWLDSYLTNRTFAVRIGDIDGKPVLLLFGVPQGSILGPLLFILYIHDMVRIAEKYGLQVHFYADDSEMYIGFSPLTEASKSMLAVKKCLNEVRNWMHANFLKINMGKTNVMFFGRHQELNLFNVDITIEGQYFASGLDNKSFVTLGIKLDNKLSMQSMVSECVQSCYFQLKNLQSIRRCLTTDEKITMVHTNILSRLDYGNVLLAASPKSLINRYQKVMNASVRFIYNLRNSQSVYMYQKQCHFLPAKYRVMYKSCLIIFKTLNNLAPEYLNDMALLQTQTRGNLRSSSDYMLVTYPLSNKCLQYHLAKNWNDLPYSLRCLPTIHAFKTSLKTHYFRLAFGE